MPGSRDLVNFRIVFMSKVLVKSTGMVSLLTFISRIFGFIRDMVTAYFFGATAAFDAFLVAFKIPNFMRRLFAEGAFSQAFVPVLSEYQKQKTQAELKQFVNAMAGSLGIVLLLVTILGVVTAPWIVRLFAAGFEVGSPRYDLAVTMLRITFPYLMLISLTAFSGAILNTHSRFWVAATTPIFLNICMISAAIWLAPTMHTPIIALAWAVFVAGVIQLLFQLPFLKNLGLAIRPRINFRDPGVRKVLKLMVPALFGVSVSQVNLLVDTLFASFLIVGSVSWLYYSDRLLELPLGVFGVAIATVILPSLSRHHATQSQVAFSQTVDWALRCILLISVPASLVLVILAGPLLSTLFQYGTLFTAYSVEMAAKSLAMFGIGVIPFMLIKVLTSGFYARQNMRTPVRIGIIAMIANIIFNCGFIGFLAHAGIALATSLAAGLNAVLLWYFLQKENLYTPSSGWGFFSLRLLFVNVLLGVWLWMSAPGLSQWVQADGIWRITHLLFSLGGGIVLYFIALYLSGLRIHDFLIREASI